MAAAAVAAAVDAADDVTAWDELEPSEDLLELLGVDSLFPLLSEDLLDEGLPSSSLFGVLEDEEEDVEGSEDSGLPDSRASADRPSPRAAASAFSLRSCCCSSS